ncbi:thioredoxin domain-containing protein [Streptomyces sp. NPDC004266]|uniref:thioredoxin domain-containing protein n=1 Tax=Streptomyces sp. NPDC004266 TaxID=3364693 RepID=UPI0036976849
MKKMSRTVRAAVALSLIGGVAGCTAGGRAGEELPAEPVGYGSAEMLPERLAVDGTTIWVGNPAARSTVEMFEDPRCPVVEEYERTGARELKELLLEGEIKAQYTLASFKDIRLGGDGSKRAVNALRAALQKGKFVEYHTVLWKFQTEVEASGGFTTERLLELAQQVPGLRDAAFDQAVRTMKYQAFVTASEQAYENTGDDPRGPGTPTIIVNSHSIDGGLYGINFDRKLFRQMIVDLHDSPYTWEKIYEPLKEQAEAEDAES